MLGMGPKHLSDQQRLKLPLVNTLVEFAMMGGGPRGSVSVEALRGRNIVISLLPGVKPGATGVFIYHNTLGKFRFSAKCVSVTPLQGTFEIPDRIETLQIFPVSQQRASVRLDATVPAHWRFAPSGKGAGDFTRGSLTDISRSGASLIVDRDVKPGTYVETRFTVSTSASPLVLTGEVMRSSVIETSKKISLGLRFNGITPEEDRAIMDFINKRQAERRNRGLA